MNVQDELQIERMGEFNELKELLAALAKLASAYKSGSVGYLVEAESHLTAAKRHDATFGMHAERLNKKFGPPSKFRSTLSIMNERAYNVARNLIQHIDGYIKRTNELHVMQGTPEFRQGVKAVYDDLMRDIKALSDLIRKSRH